MQVVMQTRYNPYIKPLKISIPDPAPMISINPSMQPFLDYWPYYHLGTYYKQLQPVLKVVNQPSRTNKLKFGIDAILGLNETNADDADNLCKDNKQPEIGCWNYEASSLLSNYCRASDSTSPTSTSSNYSPTFANESTTESEVNRYTPPESSDSVNSYSMRTSPPADTDVEKCKRVRTIFSADQMARLEQEFSMSQYMVGQERTYLAQVLNLTENQVKIWFQNRRIKWRKQNIDNQRSKGSRSAL